MEGIGIQWLTYPSCDEMEMFFKGYKPHPDGDGSMIWDVQLARKNAGLDKKRKIGSLKEKSSKSKKRKK